MPLVDQPNVGGGDTAADSINSLIQQVAGQSIAEIDRLIAELTHLREMLRSEGDRVQREIAGYASLSQTAMASTKIIADRIAHWEALPRHQT